MVQAQQPRVRPPKPSDTVIADRFTEDQNFYRDVGSRFQATDGASSPDPGASIGDIDVGPADKSFLDQSVNWAEQVRQRSRGLRREPSWQGPPEQQPRFITPQRVAANSDPLQDAEREELRTHATSMLNPMKPGPNRFHANNSEVGEAPLAGPASTTTDTPKQRSAAETRDDPEASRNVSPRDDQAIESQGEGLPLWTTLLFASLAANVFFCWSARSAHVKYQDLVADLSDGDARQQRYERRLRRGEEVPDRDEIEFLGTVDA